MAGQGGEVEECLVWPQVLVHHISPVDADNGHGEEEVEVVGLVVAPTSLPHGQCLVLRELSFEAPVVGGGGGER